MSADGPSVRDVLLAHSDDRPCRELWDAVADGGEMPDDATCLAALTATEGDLCLVAREANADMYLRYDPDHGAFVYVAVWPPWGVVDGGTTDRAGAEAKLADRDDPRPVPYEQSPLAHEATMLGAGGLGGLGGLRGL